MCRNKAFFFSTFLCVLSVFRAESPCYIEGISASESVYTNPEVINDTYIGIVQIFNNTNIQDASIQDVKYISLTVEDNILVISTTPEFKNYEENEEASTIVVNINLTCDGGNDTLEYRLQIQDENNHDPQFELDHYFYTFYESVPYLLDFALTDLQPIVARDVDLSNDKVDFEIEENDLFEINYATRNPKSSKEYFAFFFNLLEIVAPFNETFKITVTDSGTPTRSSTALVTVKVIELERPIFTKSLYVAKLTDDLKIEVSNGPIAFMDDVDNVTVNLPLDYSDYFRAEVNQDDEVELTAITSDVLDLVNKNDAIALTLKSSSNYITDETQIVIYTAAYNIEENEETEINSESTNENTDTSPNNEDTDFTTERNEEDISTTVNTEDTDTGVTNDTDSGVTEDTVTGLTEDTITDITEDNNTNIPEDDDGTTTEDAINTNESIEENNASTTISDEESEEVTDLDETTIRDDRPSTQTVYVELTGFKHWITVSQGFSMFIFIIAGIGIAGAILCIKLKLYR